jgi:ATP-dependent Clp protease ATP-binding subunit ClpA
MNDLVLAGILAGAIAGTIIGAAILAASLIVTRRREPMPRAEGWRGGSWVQRHEATTARPDAATAHQREFGPGIPPSPSFVGRGPFGLFNDRAKRVLALAQDEAIRFNHNYIGTEHLLLGLVREGEGLAARVLSSRGVELSKVRTAVEFIVGRGDATKSPSEITLSPRTKRVIEIAVAEAQRLGHGNVGTEHLLLGLVVEGEGIATGVIESLGIRLEHLRVILLSEMTGAHITSPPTAGPAAGGSHGGPFDRFDHHAKRVLALAQDEAIRFNHNYMGPEHLFLGISREGESVGGQVLRDLGLELGEIRRHVESLVGRGDTSASPSEITLTPRMKKVIELAIDESRSLGHGHVGPEHLLLGLLREGGNNACVILTQKGIPLDKVRESVIAKLDDAGGTQPSAG